MSTQKILALQFKYLGDAVFTTPSLRAIKEYWPDCELHVLVASEVVPLFENLPHIQKIWALPRTRGRVRLCDSQPVIRALRREKFDRTVDLGGNDRGAIMSFLTGARRRLGPTEAGPWLLKRFLYNETISETELPPAWVDRHLKLLSMWGVPPPADTALKIAANPTLAGPAAELLPENCVLCHLATSQPRKEWPVSSWAEFYRLATAAGIQLVFSTGTSNRERSLLDELKQLVPDIHTLPSGLDLRLFLAVLKRAKALVAGDTGPLHFAAGLGLPVVGLFAARDSLRRAAPAYPPSQIVAAAACACQQHLKNFSVCQNAVPCMATISPESVLAALKKNLATR